jgi:glycosyltransferase involved in cell wall biosynthesis
LYWIEGASDEELQRLYASCDALIAASYMEGFGLPIVEAAEYGKPVIASDIPVFREVIGESQAAAFFEAGSSSALSACIEVFSKQSIKFADRRIRRLGSLGVRAPNSWLMW